MDKALLDQSLPMFKLANKKGQAKKGLFRKEEITPAVAPISENSQSFPIDKITHQRNRRGKRQIKFHKEKKYIDIAKVLGQ